MFAPCLRVGSMAAEPHRSVHACKACPTLVGAQVLALLDRIRRQDAGEIEPPAIAIGRRGSAEGDEGEWEGSDDVIDDLDVRAHVVLLLLLDPMQLAPSPSCMRMRCLA